MTENHYINTTIQKGFTKKTPGCVEHTQALMEELKDAKTKRRQLYVVFIDLMNAYGRVPHSLIIFALKRYHLPSNFIEVILSYYDKLVVKIKTKNWSSKTFWYELGLFQGDPLSVILFLICFNILLELLVKQNHLGYKPSFSDSKTSNKAFADDLTLMAKTAKGIKQMIETVEKFLEWTQKMRAKPEKSLCLAMKVLDGKYCTFDPKLMLAGQPIPTITQRPMKFLGMWIYLNMEVKELRANVKKKLQDMMESISEDVIAGPMKVWLYNNLVVSKMSWDFIVYNFPLTFVRSLEAICNKYLKKWLGIAHPCTTTVLYRSRDHMGLQLKNIVTEYKVCQLIKGDQLLKSQDPYIKEVYSNHQNISDKKKNWSYPKELQDRQRELYFRELVGTPNTGTTGLGFNSRGEMPERKKMSEMVRTFDENSLIVSLFDKKKQNRFLTWENTMTFDTTWNNLLYKLSPALLKFHLNAIHDTAMTPSNLKLWNKNPLGNCKLCGRYGTLSHILTHCKVSLNQGRYNWRHDQVLRTIMTPVFAHFKHQHVTKTQKVTTKTVFHKAGNKSDKVRLQVQAKELKSFFSDAADWLIVYDEDKRQRNFPSHIVATSNRPDVVIFSNKLKKVMIMELTCGNEENFANQKSYKTKKYQQLIHDIGMNGWSCKYQTVEMGCRGIYNDSLPAFYNSIGLKTREKKKACQKAAEVALRASYTIYLSRANKIWSDNWDLTERPSVCIGEGTLGP